MENINAIKALRLALNLKAKEMADAFEMDRSMISNAENNRLIIGKKRMAIGLNNLGIDYENYNELENFVSSLTAIPDDELNVWNKIRLSILKAMAITETDEEVKKKYDDLIERIINAKTQKKRGLSRNE